MREILFRAKAINRDKGEHRTDYKNGDWVYGLVTKKYNKEFEALPAEMSDGYASRIEVDHETIGEFTGILDKNGNKIFEGDIVEFTDDIPGKGEIVYEDAEWSIVFFSKSGGLLYNPLSRYESKNLEIIGNKFDK